MAQRQATTQPDRRQPRRERPAPPRPAVADPPERPRQRARPAAGRPAPRRPAAPSRRPTFRTPPADDQASSPRYLVHTVPGLEDITVDEVKELVPGARVVGAW